MQITFRQRQDRGELTIVTFLEKVTTFGTDYELHMTAAVGFRNAAFQSMPCAAHILQLCVNKAVAKSGIGDLFAKCRKIVRYFKQSCEQCRIDNAAGAILSATGNVNSRCSTNNTLEVIAADDQRIDNQQGSCYEN